MPGGHRLWMETEEAQRAYRRRLPLIEPLPPWAVAVRAFPLWSNALCSYSDSSRNPTSAGSSRAPALTRSRASARATFDHHSTSAGWWTREPAGVAAAQEESGTRRSYMRMPFDADGGLDAGALP